MFQDCTKSEYTLGYDPKFKEPATLELVDIIEDAYIAGYKKNYIAKLLRDEMEMKYVNADSLCAKVWKELMKKGSNRIDGMLERNLQRLEFMYAKAVAEGDNKSALTAIDTLNKLCQLYKEKVQITTDEYIIDLLGNSGEKEEN